MQVTFTFLFVAAIVVAANAYVYGGYKDKGRDRTETPIDTRTEATETRTGATKTRTEETETDTETTDTDTRTGKTKTRTEETETDTETTDTDTRTGKTKTRTEETETDTETTGTDEETTDTRTDDTATRKKVIVDCGLPPIPKYAIVKITGTTIGSVAKHICFEGFVLVGNPIRVCKRNGYWSGNPPVCVPKKYH